MTAGPSIGHPVAGRRSRLWELLSPCRLCPRECGADRLAGEAGFCRAGVRPRVAAVSLHRGEEPPLAGTRGAGNIFFSGCNLSCRFCQNYPISQLGVGRETGVDELAGIMLDLQRRGAHNINLVTATHLAPQAATAVDLARERGLALPVAWNSNGYEKPEVVDLLGDVVDIWLPDAKYAADDAALRLSGARDYVAWSRRALAAMFRSGGHLAVDAAGLARRGLLVRHLVLPGGLAGTGEVLAWLMEAFGPELHVSLMFQYFPAHRAVGEPVLGRRLTAAEEDEALDLLRAAGFSNGWVQETSAGCPCAAFLEGCPGDGHCRRDAFC